MTAGSFRIWLARHGETEWSRTGRHTGRTDVPLTRPGRRQAGHLGARLAGRRFALVLASPLARAWETCRMAGYADAAERCEDLMEWDYGEFEGRTTGEITADHPGWSIWTGQVPGGETLEDVGRRATRAIERAEAAGGDVLMFGHGHLLRVLGATWVGLSPREGRVLALDTASLGVLGHEHGVRVITAWNVTVPLCRDEDAAGR